MNKDEEIKILVTRFMDGETTLDEERELYRYFWAMECQTTCCQYVNISAR